MKWKINDSDKVKIMHLPAKPYFVIWKHDLEDYPGKDYLLNIDMHKKTFLFEYETGKIWADMDNEEDNRKEVEKNMKEAEKIEDEVEREEWLKGRHVNHRDRIQYIIYFDDKDVSSLLKEAIDRYKI